MKFYNSLTRSKDEFTPLEGNVVRMYTCGPTVYNFAHIGNFRAYTFEDILHRALKYRGYDVKQVMNLTDVDDKTIKGAIATGKALRDYTQQYKEAFFADLKTLGIMPAAVYPAATDHIQEMIDLVSKLFEKGIAYQSDDKSVYFSVSKFEEYGKLAHLDRSGLRSSVRISNDEYEKDAVGDFALWKAWDEKDGDVWWDSPWGKGRPGWHIECSAMSMKYLGESFDIHTGGIDNLFPHHENEIAQAEAVTGKKFSNMWLHCAHLRVNGEKMSKSLGNFFTLRDLIEKGYTGREIRFVLISSQYRQPLNFTFDALVGARSAIARIDEFVSMLKDKAGATAAGTAPAWAVEAEEQFGKALDDDLNMPEALAAVFTLISSGNKQAAAMTAEEAAAVLQIMNKIDTVINLVNKEEVAIPEEVTKLLEERAEARKNKQWADSDRIRDELAAMGWAVKDTKEGQKVSPLAK